MFAYDGVGIGIVLYFFRSTGEKVETLAIPFGVFDFFEEEVVDLVIGVFVFDEFFFYFFFEFH